MPSKNPDKEAVDFDRFDHDGDLKMSLTDLEGKVVLFDQVGIGYYTVKDKTGNELIYLNSFGDLKFPNLNGVGDFSRNLKSNTRTRNYGHERFVDDKGNQVNETMYVRDPTLEDYRKIDEYLDRQIAKILAKDPKVVIITYDFNDSSSRRPGEKKDFAYYVFDNLRIHGGIEIVIVGPDTEKEKEYAGQRGVKYYVGFGQPLELSRKVQLAAQRQEKPILAGSICGTDQN